MLWDVRKNQWWSAPPERIREAYYMTLRVHYEMGALEAWNYGKRMRELYPEFMSAPIPSLRAAIATIHDGAER